jgi:hypothetical protein
MSRYDSMARPKKPAKSVKTVVALRIVPSIKKALQKAAAQDNRTVSGLAEYVLTDWLKANGYLK